MARRIKDSLFPGNEQKRDNTAVHSKPVNKLKQHDASDYTEAADRAEEALVEYDGDERAYMMSNIIAGRHARVKDKGQLADWLIDKKMESDYAGEKADRNMESVESDKDAGYENYDVDKNGKKTTAHPPSKEYGYADTPSEKEEYGRMSRLMGFDGGYSAIRDAKSKQGLVDTQEPWETATPPNKPNDGYDPHVDDRKDKSIGGMLMSRNKGKMLKK